MDPLQRIRRHIDQARADGAEHLDLSRGELGVRLRVLPDLSVALGLDGDSKLPALRSIDLSNHDLDSLPREMERLAGLAYLDIRGNLIRQLPNVPLPPLIIDTRQWQQLRDQLEDRTIFGLQILLWDIGADIDFFFEIERRNILWLSLIGGALDRIPDALWRLEQLTHLGLSNNWLSELPESIGQLQRLTHLDLRGNQLSELPESIGQLQQLTSLDLSNQRLSELPESIGQLQRLTHLDLGYNRLLALPQSIGQLRQLTRLNLSENLFSVLPESIDQLQQLPNLDLSNNHLSKLPESIGRLQQLTRLDLSDNQLSKLPESIGQLRQLTRLNLSENLFSVLPESIDQLQQLTNLDLSNNRLSKLPESIGRLQQLTRLDLGGNWLSELPESIGQLRQLTRLDLGGNRLSALPESTGQLQQLTHLDLGHNRLSALPESIGQLRQLTHFGLGSNQLSRLPESIGQLQRLTYLNLFNNRLSELAEGIGDLNALLHLRLDDNPLSDSLTAAVRSGTDAVLDYLRAKSARLYEAKLLIVGEAGAGKTTLARKPLDPMAPLPGVGESTLGINVYRDWCFPYAAGPQASDRTTGGQAQEMSANIWDFGGHEIQYATHQFFLTPNALYVLVADARRQETDYDYWLKIIRLLGRDRAPADGVPVRGTPVLVLLHEKADRQVTDFDLGTYRRRFPELAIETAEADLANLSDGRVENLRIRIQQLLSALPHVGERQPAAWRPVRTAVEKQQAEHHLSFGQFRALCTAHGIDREETARVLLRYLSFVGVCVYFDRGPLLKDFIITDPQWAVNALYLVLDRDEVQNRQGRLHRRFFYETLAAEGYQEYEIDRLFRLLQKDQFEICFPLEGSDGDLHIVPQLLPAITPEYKYKWKQSNNLHFEYQYPFMPKGLLARLIVRLHELLEVGEDSQPLIWRKGAVLRSPDTHAEPARAELVETEDPKGGRILRLRVVGPTLARRDLLAVLRYEIARTHARSFSGLEVNERIPCSCPVCAKAAAPRMYDYRELDKYVSGGRGAVYCPEGRVDVSISAMLEGVVGTTGRRLPMPSGEIAGTDKELDRLSDRDYSSLERLHSDARRVEVSPTINVQVNPELHQHMSVQQETTVSIEVRIEQKNQFCNQLGGLLDNLDEDAEEVSDADPDAVERLKTELDRARRALKKLKDNQDPDDEEKTRGPFSGSRGLWTRSPMPKPVSAGWSNPSKAALQPPARLSRSTTSSARCLVCNRSRTRFPGPTSRRRIGRVGCAHRLTDGGKNAGPQQSRARPWSTRSGLCRSGRCRAGINRSASPPERRH